MKLSRHFLSEQASCISLVPFAPGAPDQSGASLTHNLLALGAWNEDAQASLFLDGDHLDLIMPELIAA